MQGKSNHVWCQIAKGFALRYEALIFYLPSTLQFSLSSTHDPQSPLPYPVSPVMSCLVNPCKVIIHEMQGNGTFKVFYLFAESIC